ncbi:MAG: ester cyclase [Lutimonas sp.]
MLKIIAAIFTVFFVLESCNDSQNTSELESQENRNQTALIAFMDKAWNEKDLAAIDTYFSEGIVRKVNGVNLASSKNELTANLQVYFTGFPDLKIELDHMISDGNETYMSWTITGSNTGVFGELPPTGKRIKISGITRMLFDEQGKIEVEEAYYNELSLLQQMGHTLSPPVLE